MTWIRRQGSPWSWSWIERDWQVDVESNEMREATWTKILLEKKVDELITA